MPKLSRWILWFDSCEEEQAELTSGALKGSVCISKLILEVSVPVRLKQLPKSMTLTPTVPLSAVHMTMMPGARQDEDSWHTMRHGHRAHVLLATTHIAFCLRPSFFYPCCTQVRLFDRLCIGSNHVVLI